MNAKRILIVDDDQVIANIYQNKFRVEGYEAEQAGDAESALEMLRMALFDLVLLDLKSTETDSLNLLRQIRHYPPPTPMFTVAFASGGENSPAIRAFDLGLNEFVQVPFENGLLRARLRPHRCRKPLRYSSTWY